MSSFLSLSGVPSSDFPGRQRGGRSVGWSIVYLSVPPDVVLMVFSRTVRSINGDRFESCVFSPSVWWEFIYLHS